MRDKMIEGWKFSEPGLQELYQEHDFGSGYPSDPKCKAWMDQALQDPVFGYSDLVRFSWAPCKSRLAPSGDNEFNTATKAIPVVFEADLDEEEMEKRQSQKGMSAFLAASAGISNSNSNSNNTGKSGAEGKKRKRSSYFKSRKLQVVNVL
jgi:ribonuclease H2 subunit A